MRNHRRALPVLVVLMTLVGVAQAGGPPRLRASWKEKDARVVVFSPDGRSLVSSGAEGHRLRDAATGRVRAVLSGPPLDLLRKLVFTPDSRTLFAQAASDRSRPLIVHDVKAWDVESGQVRGEFPYVAEHLDEGSFALSGDGRRLALVDNSQRLPIKVKTEMLFIIDGRHEVTISHNTNPGLPRVKLWDVPGWKEIAVVDGGLPLAFSPAGEILATGDRNWRTPVARLWFADSGRPYLELKDRAEGLWPLAFSPDGQFLASGEHKETSFWDVADGRRWSIGAGGRGLSSQGPAFSPDGTLLFPKGFPFMRPEIGQPEEYHCFSLDTLPPRRLDLGPGELVISPDGRRYAAVLGERGKGDPRPVVLRELPSLRETGRLDVTGLGGAGFSPDGRRLVLLVWKYGAISSMEIQLIDPATARVTATIAPPGPTWGNYGWKFSPDGNTLAVWYRTGSNVVKAGEPDPSDRPMNAEIWELPPQ